MHFSARIEAMDAQRFDPALKSPLSTAHELPATKEVITSLEFLTGIINSTSTEALMRETALDSQRYNLARQEALSPDNSPAGTICHSLAGESDNDHSSNSSSTDVETEAAKPVKSPIDVNDKTELINDYTCTIIRPQPRSGIFDVFSRPCSPISILSRPGSPMSFSTLNCFGSSDNFEDDVQILEVQRARRAEVKIIVTASKEVYSEKWDEQATATSPLLRRRTSLEIQLEEKMTEQMIEAQKRRARYYEGHREECSM